MIQVKRGNSLLTVTRGAYLSYYKRLGYEPVDAAEQPENKGEETTQPPEDSQLSGDSTQPKSAEESDEQDIDGDEDETDDEESSGTEVDLSEIPLSELSHSQLFEYADQLGLDYEGTPSRKELLELVRTHLKG